MSLRRKALNRVVARAHCENRKADDYERAHTALRAVMHDGTNLHYPTTQYLWGLHGGERARFVDDVVRKLAETRSYGPKV